MQKLYVVNSFKAFRKTEEREKIIIDPVLLKR